MTEREALKMALEALGEIEWSNDSKWQSDRAKVAITAIKEALAQPEQPKVRTGNCLRVGVCASEGHKIQPQRTWVGLTEQDRMEISDKLGLMDVAWLDLMEAIEAKLKEKNT